MIQSKMMKTVYPRIHNRKQNFQLSENIANSLATIVPILNNDEGLGDPASFQAHPEHSSFAEVDDAGCYPESTVRNIMVKARISLTKECYETDKLEVMRLGIMPIYLAFSEDYLAIDEKSSNEIQDILKLQKESTDRQGYPVFNTVKLVGDKLETGATQLGLTSNTNIEGVSFLPEVYYDMLHYGTNSGKLKTVQGGLKWFDITRRKVLHYNMRIKTVGKIKRINPYTFCGLLFVLGDAGTGYAHHYSPDVSAIKHVNVMLDMRYNEWNENFDMTKT